MSAESLQLLIQSRWQLPDSLGTLARGVYLYLAIDADRGSLEYTGGSKALARYFNVSTRSITNALAELKSVGVITCTRRETAHLRPKAWRLNELTNGGSTLLPSEVERVKQSAPTVELQRTNGGTTAHQREKPASSLQETTNKRDKSTDREQALAAIRHAMPGEYQRSFTTPPKLKQLLTTVLERGYTVEALELEFKAYPWQTKSPDRVGFAVQDKLEALANAEPPRPPRPTHFCEHGDECRNGIITVEQNGKPRGIRCTKWLEENPI